MSEEKIYNSKIMKLEKEINRIEKAKDIIQKYPELKSYRTITVDELIYRFETLNMFNNIDDVIKKAHERCAERDLYGRAKDDEDYTGIDINFSLVLESYEKYFKYFGRLISDDKVPMFPKDVFDIVYNVEKSVKDNLFTVENGKLQLMNVLIE